MKSIVVICIAALFLLAGVSCQGSDNTETETSGSINTGMDVQGFNNNTETMGSDNERENQDFTGNEADNLGTWAVAFYSNDTEIDNPNNNETTQGSFNETEVEGSNFNETEAREFLEEYNVVLINATNKVMIWYYEYMTNMTTFNRHQTMKYSEVLSKLQKDMRKRALVFNDSAMSSYTRRQLAIIKNVGVSAYPNTTKLIEIMTVSATLQGIFTRAQVCLASNSCVHLDPNITNIMAKSRDYDEILELWVGWRNATGQKMKSLYSELVEGINEIISYLGFPDFGAHWRSSYETPNIEDDVRTLWEQVLPLYQQLHAYVRRKLRNVYGESRFPRSGHIPAHILGNMWAQQWSNIYDLVAPYKNRTSIEITEEMVRQNYTVMQIYKTAEDFYTSLGFEPMVPTFWNRSMFVRPTDNRTVDCHGSAWDFMDGKDFRIKMCTVVTQNDFMTVHHEMGHIVYDMEYRNLPLMYRDGANDGFHEAIGDVMTLSVQTPEHLYKLGLISEVPEDEEGDINFLMNMALQKVAFLPFGYLIDLWRWSVFSGQTTPDTYNTEWWRLRCEMQGVSPPVPRSEDDFDPGAKYHVPHSVPYLRYFISFIIQFQFHKAACDAAGYTGPIHRCDIYGNKVAGQKLRSMLQLGRSKPWPEAMQQFTGQDKMDAGPLLEYFEPLHRFLRQENGDDVGWNSTCSQ